MKKSGEKRNKSLQPDVGSQMTGVGDVIKKVTNFLGIETCDACEERRKKLNEMFPFIKSGKQLTDGDIEFLKRIRFQNSISSVDRTYLFNLYNSTFNKDLKNCLCSSTIVIMRDELWNLYLANHSKNIEE